MGQKTKLEAEALNLLSCWHKLEHFSPASLPKGRNMRMLTDIPPWEAPPWKGPPRKLAKGKTIEYTLYLGVFNSSEVTDFVKKFFHDTTEDPNHRSSNICMASLKVDQQGLYIANSLGISTLLWALEQLNKKKIRYVDWGALFKKLQDDIRLRLEYVLTQPLSLEALLSIQQTVIASLGWGKHLRTSIVYKEEEKPIRNDAEEKNNAELLNSFYVDDLERIIKKFSVKNSATPFLHYLQGCLNDSDSHRINLSEQTAVLKESLTPLNYPDGCWPSKYTLSLMQQYAVNSLVSRLADAHQGDILSVNGPPGTGKTTLLRDVIAAIIVNWYSLKHIMPKKWINHWEPVAEAEQDKRNKKLLTLGNLTIITSSLNTSIRDADWNTKKHGRGEKQGLRQYASGIETFAPFLEEPEWNEYLIEQRANFLFEKAKEVWPAQSTSTEDQEATVSEEAYQDCLPM